MVQSEIKVIQYSVPVIVSHHHCGFTWRSWRSPLSQQPFLCQIIYGIILSGKKQQQNKQMIENLQFVTFQFWEQFQRKHPLVILSALTWQKCCRQTKYHTRSNHITSCPCFHLARKAKKHISYIVKEKKKINHLNYQAGLWTVCKAAICFNHSVNSDIFILTA